MLNDKVCISFISGEKSTERSEHVKQKQQQQRQQQLSNTRISSNNLNRRHTLTHRLYGVKQKAKAAVAAFFEPLICYLSTYTYTIFRSTSFLCPQDEPKNIWHLNRFSNILQNKVFAERVSEQESERWGVRKHTKRRMCVLCTNEDGTSTRLTFM